MKIALFASRFFPHIGGVEEVVRQMAHQERLHNEMPLIVTNQWPKDLPAVETFEGIPLRRYNFRVPERTWKQIGGTALFGPGTIRNLCGELRTYGAEMLHVHCVSSNAYYALWAKKILGLPLVVTLHSELTMDAGQLFQRSEFARGLLRRVLREADAITAVSCKTLEDAEAFYGASLGSRARVIYNGIQADEFAQGEAYVHPRPYLLGIGRLVPQKGFDVLLEAFAQANLPEHDLLIAGDGAEQAALEELARKLKIEKRVQFLGRADRTKTLALFRGCDFLALPSRADEGLPMVLMESLAAGKPVVASRAGGVPEAVLDGETGLLVPKEDVGALAQALQSVAGNRTLRDRLAAGALSRAQKFQWREIAKQYAEVYQAVNAARAGRGK